MRVSSPWIRRLLSLVVVVLIAGCGQRGVVSVQDGYLNLPPAGAMMAGGFVEIDNQSSDDVTVIGAAVEGFGRVEIHETKLEGGMMRMRPRPELLVPAGQSVRFAPGGLHMMLMQPQGKLQAGDVLRGQLNIRGKDGTEQTLPITLDVRVPAGMVNGSSQ